MKKNKLFLGIASVVALVLLIPALIIPSIGAGTQTLSARNYGFNNQAIGSTSTALKDAYDGTTTYPTTATIAANPANPNSSDRVLRIDSKTVDTGKVAEFIAVGTYAYEVIWDDASKATGTAKYNNKTLTLTSTDGGKTVVASDSKTYTVSTDAALREAVGGGSNVDKNVTVGNVKMSYSELANPTVVLQAEYYIPTGALGTFESQIVKYSTNGTAKTYLNLFKINLGTGAISSGDILGSDDKVGSFTLEKDVWNTVSVVVNLETGAAELYINNILVFGGRFSIGGTVLTNLVFDEGNWNIAKLNKQSSLGNFGGCFYVNNARYHSYDATKKIDLSSGSDLLYTEVTLASGRKVGASSGDTILANIDVVYQNVRVADYADMIAPVEGASLRLTNTSGLRFATQINTAMMNELVAAKAAGHIKNVEIGTLITPYAYVTEAGNFTIDALKTLSYSAKYLDVKATVGGYFNPPGLTPSEGYNTFFVGSIIDIKPANRNRLFTGMGYVKVTQNNGTVRYIYSYDYNNATTQESKYSRSISYIASVFVNDPDFSQYQELLQSFVQGMTVPALSSSIIQNVQYSYNEFFFQNAAGVACQLIYDGNNGWRLQAVKPTQTNSKYNEFDNMGAAQALSQYLGEEHDDKAMKLIVTNDSSKFTIRAEGTDSYVTLNITGSFNLRFFSPKGVLMNNVTAITASGTSDKDKSIKLTGDLLTGEAIYGGGERFDAANKRGKSMSLYSYDAYNSGVPGTANEAGTYTVIPLFTSSRGSGMYINRYEIMTADWGETSSNQWSVTIQNDLIDCYFYSTGNMADAIYGYTDLAGHATLPEEWAQGVLICRYSPDFTGLNGEKMYFDKLEDIPGYETLTLSSGGDPATTKTSWTKGDKLYSGSSIKYIYADYDFDGDYEFVRTSKKGGAPMGAGVKAIVEGLIDAGMKPTAMVLEGLGWTSLGTNSSQYANFVEVINWLEERDINTTIYMAVGEIGSGMPGYKAEYQLKANVTYSLDYGNGDSDGWGGTYHHEFTAGTQTTTKIPKNAGSDNPDAVGTGTQTYLDITNPEAVDWYMDVVWGQLIELGVDGCKIDFCETMPNEGFTFDLVGTKTSWLTGTTSVKVGTATLEYQWYDDTVFEGDDVHHAYSSYFISLFCQRMLEKAPEGFVVLNRGGGIGMQRNPYMWAGDQTREEITLTTQLMVVLNSGISGLPFMTYDMAGYAYGAEPDNYWNGTWDAAGAEAAKKTESEIFIRAIQYTAFSLMIQTHGDVRHLYDLSEEAQTISAQYTALHDELMPYIRKYSQIACETGLPVLRLLVLHYQNDTNVYDINDQYMFGDGLMVAPILELGSTSRTVYLPEGNWIDLLTGKEYSVGANGQTITVTAKLNQIPVFLNADSDDAHELAPIFNGSIWQKINGGHKIRDFYTDDPAQDDIFGKK